MQEWVVWIKYSAGTCQVVSSRGALCVAPSLLLLPTPMGKSDTRDYQDEKITISLASTASARYPVFHYLVQVGININLDIGFGHYVKPLCGADSVLYTRYDHDLDCLSVPIQGADNVPSKSTSNRA